MMKKILVSLVIIVLCTNLFALADDSLFSDNDYVLTRTIWDIDFNNSKINIGDPEFVVNFADENGVNYKNGNDYLGAHAGSAESKIILDTNEYADRDNGQSIRMNANNAKDEVQFNNLRTSAADEVIMVYEFDVCASDFNAEKQFRPVYLRTQNGSTANEWCPKFSITTSGLFSFMGKTTPASVNTWFTVKIIVDIPAAKEYCFVNGVLLGESPLVTDGYSGMFKLSLAMKGAVSEVWYDNIKAYEIKKIPQVIECKAEGDSIELTLDNPIKYGEDTSDFKVSVGQKPVGVSEITQISDNTLKVILDQKLPTAMDVDCELKYFEGTIKHKAATDPASVDVVDVYVTNDSGVYTAYAIGHNKTQEERGVIMMLVLFDENGRVVSLNATPKTTLVDGEEISVSTQSNKAAYYELYFLNDWTSLSAFKNVIY